MNTQLVHTNQIQIHVQTDGDARGKPLLMIMGLGMQLTGWPQGLVDLLVAHGFYVIRFDNRDAGYSTQFDSAGTPNIGLEMLKYRLGFTPKPAYRLADMAADAAGVLDALGIPRAHVCGASMGGMIAQHMLIAHPERLSSLTLMMTHIGGRRVPQPTLAAMRALVSRPKSRQRDDLVTHLVNVMQVIGSPAYRLEPAALKRRIEQSVDRAPRPQGTLRQMLTIAAEPNRGKALMQAAQRRDLPLQIIHGAADPLIPARSTKALHQALSTAAIDLVPGMGHDLPEPLWPRFVERISAAAQAAKPA